VWFDAHPIVCSALVVGMNVGVLKSNKLKVLVVPSLPFILLVSNEEVCLMSPTIEAQC
jgi:hypothetical protein